MFFSSNFTPKTINVFPPFFFSIWLLFFYITIFLRDFCQINSFFFPVLSSNTRLVVNWESWLSLVGLCRAHNRGDRFKKLTWVILVFFYSFTLCILSFFSGFFKIIMVSCMSCMPINTLKFVWVISSP